MRTVRRYAAILLLVSVSWGGWWKQDEDCDGDVCFPARIELDLYKPAASRSGLSYRETIEVTSSVRDILNICLPNTDPSFVANNFVSCEGKAMKTVCKMAKRNWLVNTENNETVANVDLLLSNLNDLAGAEEAVRECLQVPEEYEEYAYYYDYDYYYDDYDYLEEAAEGVRVRREAGNGEKREKRRRTGRKSVRDDCKPGKKGCKRRSAKGEKKEKPKGKDKCDKDDRQCKRKMRQKKRRSRNNKKNCPGPKCKRNNNGKGEGRARKAPAGKKPKKPNKDKKDKNKENKEEKQEKRKARKYKKKKPNNKEKVDKEVNAMLSSLGLASLPSKSDLDSLHCVYHEVANLVRDCAQKKLNE